MKEFIKKLFPKSLLSFYHKILAVLAVIFYQFPSNKMIIIGVTGTNGKTTTCNLIARILEEAGFKVGLATTANFKIAGREWINNLKQTMPGRFKLQKLLWQMLKEGCRYAVIETSSEGIIQHRAWGINYDVAIFTNLTPEHIESHGSFENYKKAKGVLFSNLARKEKNIGENKVKKISVINLDDKEADYFLQFVADEKWGYGIKLAIDSRKSKIKTLKADSIKLTPRGVGFNVRDIRIELNLLGRFNVYNALAAVSVALSQGIDWAVIKKALEKIKVIPGRMELIDEGQNFTVIVDYAHEPVALANVYHALNSLSPSKIISVLGACGGGRDKSKRPILGKLAAQYTDYVIVTNEDPYDENPEKILEAVLEGVIKGRKILGENCFKIIDRKEAIKFALKKAQAGDVVIITGKGSEQCIVQDNKKIPWDDRKIVREILRSKQPQNKTALKL